MRTVIVGVALAVGATLLTAGPVRAQVTAEALAASDVVVDPGANVSAGERDRLQTAAEDRRRRGTPTKFVVVAGEVPAGDPDPLPAVLTGADIQDETTRAGPTSRAG